jgi:hypothetical protein
MINKKTSNALYPPIPARLNIINPTAKIRFNHELSGPSGSIIDRIANMMGITIIPAIMKYIPCETGSPLISPAVKLPEKIRITSPRRYTSIHAIHTIEN